MPHHWIAVACADHVRRGVAGGFMQVNHGKVGPLRRMRPGDGIVYYSPSERMRQPDGLQSFSAIGRIREGEPYRGVMAAGFEPFRRDVDWFAAKPMPIRPLLPTLHFASGGGWGYRLRFGVLEVDAADFLAIAAAMEADAAECGMAGSAAAATRTADAAGSA